MRKRIKREKKAPKKTDLTATGPRRAGSRGWLVPGGGTAEAIEMAPEWRATTKQVCGLFPFNNGAGLPTTGVPLGRHLYTRATVCADPISWYMRANLISNPSAFVLGLPGLGKSTLVRKMLLGLWGYGFIPIVPGDVKGEYSALMRNSGRGQVIDVGRNHINVLNPGGMYLVLGRLSKGPKEELLRDGRARQHTMVGALVSILRKSNLTVSENLVVKSGLRMLEERFFSTGEIPVLPDLLQLVKEGPEELLQATLSPDKEAYRKNVRELEMALMAIVSGAVVGDTFSAQTDEQMRLDAGVSYDISSIPVGDEDATAAALIACWSESFAAINAQHALAEEGLEPRRRYFMTLDELWRSLRAGPGMVDRVDASTRLNRAWGVGTCYLSHTMSDTEALPEVDRVKALGFVERAGMLFLGGLPGKEVDENLRRVMTISEKEKNLLKSWSAPESWNAAKNMKTAKPGQGKFLIKVGSRPGIPLEVALSQREKRLGIHDTDQAWTGAEYEGVA